jgi:hypothetical protein
MTALAVQTGLRVSELTSSNCDAINLGDGTAVCGEGADKIFDSLHHHFLSHHSDR